jgi:hypothetical protein
MTQIRRVLLLVVLVLACAGSAFAWPLRPNDHFLTLHTALKAAIVAEDVFPQLTRRLLWTPHTPIDIVLTDYTDEANGYSAVSPIQNVHLYMAPPFADDRLDYCDDWLRMLITHELTHSVHLDEVRALPAVGRAVLGRVLPIGELQPIVLVEGTAVHEETALTTRGRGRSPASLMMLRMAALDHRWPTLDQISSNTTQYPNGNGPYIWGGMFMHFLATRYGEFALAYFHRKHAGQVWPFLFNHNAKKVFGKSLSWLYKDWTRAMREGFEQQRDRLATEGLREGQRLTTNGYTHSRPRWDGPFTLLYEEATGSRTPQIRRLDVRDPRRTDQKMLTTRGTKGLTLAPNGDWYFADAEPWDHFHGGYDLWHWRPGALTRQRLTRLARATEPVFVPGQNGLLCITQDGGRTRLSSFDLTNQKLENIVEFGEHDDYVQFSNPAVRPQGDWVALSVWHDDGNRDIFSYEPATKTFHRLTADPEQDLDPAFSPDGRKLFFSSARTGIYNIFALDLETNELYQVTNVVGGAFSPAIDPTGARLVYSGYNGGGYDLYWLPLEPDKWKKVERETIEADELVVGPISRQIDERARHADEPTDEYSAWRTVWPHWWFPDFAIGSNDFSLGIETGGQDALGYHGWDFDALYDFRRHTVSTVANYVYSGLTPILHVGGGRRVEDDGPIVHHENGDVTDYWEQRISGQFDIMWPFFARHFLVVGYHGEWRDNYERLTNANVEAAYSGFWSGLRLGWMYSSVRSYLESVAGIDGTAFNVMSTFYDPAFGSDFRQQIVTADVTQYAPLPLRNHSLMFRLAGGVSFGELLPQRTFRLGGFSTTDMLGATTDSDRFALRGYTAGFVRGDRALVGTVEWPFPIVRINRGISTWPVLLQTINAAPFFDAGLAIGRDQAPRVDDIYDSAGVTISLDTVFVYHYSVRLATVFAYGLRDTDRFGGFHWLLSTGIPYL